ncbi:2Fe-2S iron-sulfur cluster-binding protein [Chelativorans alearense]|uniref:2Fe-2S iron-sulfur cluster-binding protein n=1 Tax=Chelativorans alearense TaxID=2681495 RepID=UPI0013D0DA6D|nr:2Fe-2S iron-sulfur cluster-binding protein [Chelativorans alearense]
MTSVTFRSHDGSTVQVNGELGVSLMQTALSNGIDGIVGECGGSAMCATCHVYVDEAFVNLLPPMNDVENEMLECTVSTRRASSRLSCQIRLSRELEGLVVELPETQA